MKKPWSVIEKEIVHELQELYTHNVSLLLVQTGAETRMVTIAAFAKSGGGVLVECDKGGDYSLGGDDVVAYFFYKKEGQALMRGFIMDLERESQHRFRIKTPKEIFEVQRRQHHRVFTPDGSTLSCAPRNTRRMLTAQVLDVSLEGARIYGLLVGVEGDTVLSPITMVLTYGDPRTDPVSLNISEAEVVRIVRKGEKVEVAFSFASSDTNQDLLRQYIDRRIVEQEVE